MAHRQNFSRPVKAEIARRAVNAIGEKCCENCGAVGVPLELHHLRMDALQTPEAKRRKLTAADGAMWCEACHDPETAAQRGVLAKVERVEAKHLGTARQTSAPLASRNDLKRAPRAPKRLSEDKRCAGPSAFARRFGLKEDA